ncbi:uncharacterized protein PAC_01248 [Phialocephala subalpina]|uniref:DUF6594 domain-containing protein n=1 Tax=Phialocephala subalpina TaxID=576137 RepID=A0A1L7WF19_9HELO|nr:uncharacterized protein PAC_01248 [Phialocephala subalpina]
MPNNVQQWYGRFRDLPTEEQKRIMQDFLGSQHQLPTQQAVEPKISTSRPKLWMRKRLFKRKDSENSAPEPITKVERFAPEEFEAMKGDSFEKRLQEFYGETVICVNESSVKVNLASLQRIELHRLQRELVEEAIKFKYDGRTGPSSSDSFRDDEKSTIHKYTDALRDWDYMTKCALRGVSKDPFIVTTDKMLDLLLLEEVVDEWRKDVCGSSRHNLRVRSDHLLSKLDEDIRKIVKLTKPRESKRWEMFGGSGNIGNQEEAFAKFLRRLGMLGVGWSFLIGPMLLMVLRKSLLTTLLTTSLCVLAFGMYMTWVLDEPFDVLSGTAAYAAVFVVFIGTSTSS